MARSSAGSRGGGRGRGRGGGRGRGTGGRCNARESTPDNTSVDTPIRESNDASIRNSVDSESSLHRRGSNILDETPTDPSQRKLIQLLNSEFECPKVTRDITLIFKSMYYEPWASWRQVDNASRQAIWARFNALYRWENVTDELVHRNWLYVMGKKYPSVMRGARLESIFNAKEAGVILQQDMSVLKPFPPTWIDDEKWAILIDGWNTPRWKNKSTKAQENRNKLVEGQTSRHSCGSISISQHHYKMEKRLKRVVSPFEVYQHTHTRKASRLGTVVNEGESLVSGSQVFVSTRAQRVAMEYQENLMERHGVTSPISVPTIDNEIWNECTGRVQNGRVYGFGSMADPNFLVQGSPESACTNGSRVSNSQADEIRVLNERLEQEKEERKKDLEAMQERQRQFEEQMRTMLARSPPTPPPS